MVTKAEGTSKINSLNDSNNGHPNTLGIITINVKVKWNVRYKITSNRNCLKFG